MTTFMPNNQSGIKDNINPQIHPFKSSFLVAAQSNISKDHGHASADIPCNTLHLMSRNSELSEVNESSGNHQSFHSCSSASVSSPISCMEWNPNPIVFLKDRISNHEFKSISTGLLAVGTASGAVTIFNWRKLLNNDDPTWNEIELCANHTSKATDLEKGPGPCSALSWNRLHCSLLAAGFENSKRCIS